MHEKNIAEILVLKQHLEEENMNKIDLLQEKEKLTNYLTEIEKSRDEFERKVHDLQNRILELEESKMKVEEELSDKVTKFENTNNEIVEEIYI